VFLKKEIKRTVDGDRIFKLNVSNKSKVTSCGKAAVLYK
jgi:hypothetical protein